MLITAFLKDQGRASCHPVCTGAVQGPLAQHSAISTENSIINLNIIATILPTRKASELGVPYHLSPDVSTV